MLFDVCLTVSGLNLKFFVVIDTQLLFNVRFVNIGWNNMVIFYSFHCCRTHLVTVLVALMLWISVPSNPKISHTNCECICSTECDSWCMQLGPRHGSFATRLRYHWWPLSSDSSTAGTAAVLAGNVANILWFTVPVCPLGYNIVLYILFPKLAR